MQAQENDGATDRRYMERALALAARGRGCTSPNPMVGCVLVRDGAVLGEGFHARAGEAHAEVAALEAARAKANGAAEPLVDATVYVTLEPCTIKGCTPPCVELFLRNQPARMVVAMADPNPRVSGAGIDRLRDAGIQVEVGLMEDEARRLNEVFVKHIRTGRPFVLAKCAMTLDGKIATRTGHSRWVTGEAARRRVHELRDDVDGILVGSRTVMLDDPSLTTRLENGRGKDPVRIVLDADECLDAGRRVFHLESDAPTWVAVTKDRDYPGADALLRMPLRDGGVDLAALMDELGARKVTSLMIEGGGTTLAAAFDAGIVDKVLFFVAPKIAGGREAVSPVEGLGCAAMDEAIALENMRAEPVGEDLLIEAYVRKG